jgi:hypothetical protein
MTSRATSPEFTRKGARSALPVPRSRRTSNPSTCAPRILTSKRPLSPPRSPPIETPPPPSPSRSPKNVHWDTSSRKEKEDGKERRELERKESTDSMRENERFSPIPWVMSPPGSPPPLSLYSSVALLHYHIHHNAGPLPSDNLESLVSNPTEIVSTASTAHSPFASRSPSIPSSPPIPRSTRVLPAQQALEEFKAVENALTKSPYIIPQDLLPRGSGKSAPQANTRSDIVIPTSSLGESVSRVVDAVDEVSNSDGSDGDELAKFVEGYSFEEESRSDRESILSSPFIECTRPSVPVEDEDALEPISSDDNLISTSAQSCRLPASSKTADCQQDDLHPSSTLENQIPFETPTREPLTRMPSIQRRGQEYLAQFMAKRKRSTPTAKASQSPSSPSPPANRRTTYTFSISPLILVLCLLLLLSFVTNLFLITRLYQIPNTTPLSLDTLMKPGRVGETFDIFTTPSTNWWTRRPKDPDLHIPAPPPTRTTPLHVPKVEWKIFRKERLSFGRSGKRRVLKNIERNLELLLGRSKIFIQGAWARALGR